MLIYEAKNSNEMYRSHSINKVKQAICNTFSNNPEIPRKKSEWLDKLWD